MANLIIFVFIPRFSRISKSYEKQVQTLFNLKTKDKVLYECQIVLFNKVKLK